jgi:hypothetical protein
MPGWLTCLAHLWSVFHSLCERNHLPPRLTLPSRTLSSRAKRSYLPPDCTVTLPRCGAAYRRWQRTQQPPVLSPGDAPEVASGDGVKTYCLSFLFCMAYYLNAALICIHGVRLL